MSYIDKLVNVSNEIEGIGNWTWIKTGTDAFAYIVNEWNESHKEKFLKYTEGRRNVCVQAGGCMGMHPRLFSEYFGRVYTFEPDPLNFFCLAVNCQRDNIIKMQAALGNENKLISINRSVVSNPGMNTINENHQIIPMITIDSLNLDACDFMQLDVEYYELNVLRGALKTIEKYKPVITCEIAMLSWFDRVQEPGSHHNGKLLKDNTLEADILDLLSPFGYQKVDKSLSDSIFMVV